MCYACIPMDRATYTLIGITGAVMLKAIVLEGYKIGKARLLRRKQRSTQASAERPDSPGATIDLLPDRSKGVWTVE